MVMLDEDINGKCDKRTLAAHGPFGVHLCRCGAVHLTSGFVDASARPRSVPRVGGRGESGTLGADRAKHSSAAVTSDQSGSRPS